MGSVDFIFSWIMCFKPLEYVIVPGSETSIDSGQMFTAKLFARGIQEPDKTQRWSAGQQAALPDGHCERVDVRSELRGVDSVRQPLPDFGVALIGFSKRAVVRRRPTR